jgi:hypothetical protein
VIGQPIPSSLMASSIRSLRTQIDRLPSGWAIRSVFGAQDWSAFSVDSFGLMSHAPILRREDMGRLTACHYDASSGHQTNPISRTCDLPPEHGCRASMVCCTSETRERLWGQADGRGEARHGDCCDCVQGGGVRACMLITAGRPSSVAREQRMHSRRTSWCVRQLAARRGSSCIRTGWPRARGEVYVAGLRERARAGVLRDAGVLCAVGHVRLCRGDIAPTASLTASVALVRQRVLRHDTLITASSLLRKARDCWRIGSLPRPEHPDGGSPYDHDW